MVKYQRRPVACIKNCEQGGSARRNARSGERVSHLGDAVSHIGDAWKESAREQADELYARYVAQAGVVVGSVAKAGHSIPAVVDIIGDAWKESASSLASGHRDRSKELSEQKHIRLILVDGSNNEEDSFHVPPSETLKSCFTEYAEKHAVSLRSLRFSYNGKTIFLSSVGNKSPEELNMQDADVITVHNTRNGASQEASGALRETPPKTNHQKNGAVKNKEKRNKCKSKKKRITQVEKVVTLEEHKRAHSIVLSRVHEEVQPRLKNIRTRLNALHLERQPPKQRKKRKEKKTLAHVGPQLLSNVIADGKAGRPYFLVRVGEENNLYRTTRLPPQNGPGPCDIPVLDLHGFTREEALTKLEESLRVWVETAIQGSFPFVIPAKIVCGCGNQILSETVQKWIRSTKNICNAPKSSTSGGMFRDVV